MDNAKDQQVKEVHRTENDQHQAHLPGQCLDAGSCRLDLVTDL
jgi:hypothetical protein